MCVPNDTITYVFGLSTFCLAKLDWPEGFEGGGPREGCSAVTTPGGLALGARIHKDPREMVYSKGLPLYLPIDHPGTRNATRTGPRKGSVAL